MSTPLPVRMMLVQGRSILLIDDGHILCSVDAKTGNKIWSIDIESIFIAAPTVHREQIYVCTGSGVLHQIDLSTGQITKRSIIDIPTPVDDILAVDGEVMFLFGGSCDATGEMDASLLAINISDNTPIWENKLKSASPTATQSEQYLLLLEDGTSLSCLDKRTGKIHWQIREGPQYSHEDMPRGRPILSGNTVFWHSGYGVYACDVQNGAELWSCYAGVVTSMAEVVSSMYVSDEHVYAISLLEILCLDRHTGKPLWNLENDFYDWYPVFGDGVFYGYRGNKISAVIPTPSRKMENRERK